MNGTYFESYHYGKLQNQKKLCEILKGYDYKYHIETSEANPMTIRLLIAHDYLAKIKEISKRLALGVLTVHNPPGMVSGAHEIDIIVLDQGTYSSQSFNTVEIHKALFEFFTNLGSALDRMAHEVGVFCDLIKSENGYAVSSAKVTGLADTQALRSRLKSSGSQKRRLNR